MWEQTRQHPPLRADTHQHPHHIQTFRATLIVWPFLSPGETWRVWALFFMSRAEVPVRARLHAAEISKWPLSAFKGSGPGLNWALSDAVIHAKHFDALRPHFLGSCYVQRWSKADCESQVMNPSLIWSLWSLINVFIRLQVTQDEAIEQCALQMASGPKLQQPPGSKVNKEI